MQGTASYIQIREKLLSGEISCVSLVQYYLDAIARQNGELNAFLTIYDDEALLRASEIDKKIAAGKQGKLAGLVVSLKDVLCYIDHPLQCGSKILDGFHSQFSATCVERLLTEDAIIIGRNNCDEFAMGSSCENSAFGPVKNAADTTRVPGGSSGGSAVAVQSGMCMASLGTDTGGSVRQPASFCGVVGLKPTYSRISRHGLASYASTFDTIGIFTHSIEDAALILEVIAGEDEFDSTVSTKPVPAYSRNLTASKPARVAFLKETLASDALNDDVRASLFQCIGALEQAGHRVEEASMPLMEYALPTYYILTTAEASSNFARYDGVKYGYRVAAPKNLENMYKQTRTIGFGEEVLRRIMLGTFVLSASYHDAFYTKAQKVRRMIKDQLEKLFEKYDFIIMPTAPTPAFPLGSKTKDPMEMYLADLFTVQASVAGVPAISVPVGKDANGLPIGLQIMSPAFTEGELLAFSKIFQQN